MRLEERCMRSDKKRFSIFYCIVKWEIFGYIEEWFGKQKYLVKKKIW
jgi:hypothetical protein